MTDNTRVMHDVRSATLSGNVPLVQYSFTTKYLTRLAIGTERGAL